MTNKQNNRGPALLYYNCTAAFLDISQVFDKVWHEVIQNLEIFL